MKITTQIPLHHIILFVLLVRYNLGPIPWLQKELSIGQQARLRLRQRLDSSQIQGWNLNQTKVHGDFTTSFRRPRFHLNDRFKGSSAERNAFVLKTGISCRVQVLPRTAPLPSWHPAQVTESCHTAGAGQNPCPTFLHMDGGVPLSSNTQAEFMTSFLAAPLVCVSFA